MTIAFLSHSECYEHQIDPQHPEAAERLWAVQDALVAAGLDLVVRHYEAPQASREQLLRVHELGYVDSVFARAPAAGTVWLDGDTAMNPHTLAAALRAAGAVVKAVELVVWGEAGAAFCNVRPPGHHAGRERAMGFCIFNNVAVGAAHALQGVGLERVAIVDFDVHHGNGTEDIFAGEPGVLFCSTFQHPFYPFSGERSSGANVVNVPLEAGADGAAFREAVRSRWLGPLERFAPELVMVSAGFDAHSHDDMSHLRLTERDYTWVTQQIKRVAEASAQGRVVSVLEGGYDLPSLGRSVAAHIDALLGHDPRAA